MLKKLKGIAMFSFVLGLIVTIVGVALLYLLPEYIISTLNSTGVFTNTTIATANSKADQVRGVGFVVIVIGIIWMIIAVLSGANK